LKFLSGIFAKGNFHQTPVSLSNAILQGKSDLDMEVIIAMPPSFRVMVPNALKYHSVVGTQ
jgi:hypothetical protein